MTTTNIHTYILYSEKEVDRKGHINTLQQQLGNTTCIEAIFPKFEKVPFLHKLITLSGIRTGKCLSEGEIGCILGHRKIWKMIAKQTNLPFQHFLILESDSQILIAEHLKKIFTDHFLPGKTRPNYDLFFWGAWNGNTRIKKSTQINIFDKYKMGTPLIKSIYGTYGYSITPSGASILLKNTARINYPIDYFKFHLKNVDIKIGAIRPAIIDTWKTTPSSIVFENKWVNIKREIIIRIFDFRNMIIAYFC